MGIIFVGLIAGLMIATFSWKIGLGIGILFVLISLLPLEGYDHPECKKTVELIPLRRKEKREKYYVQMFDKKAIYAFDNSDKYDLDGGAYEEKVQRGKIKVYESSKCETPVLKVMVTTPKVGIFALAPFSTKKEYIFYVPEGTVLNKQDKIQLRTSNVV